QSNHRTVTHAGRDVDVERLGTPHNARATAGRARLVFDSARAIAPGTGRSGLNRNRPRCPAMGVFQADLHLGFDVTTAHRERGAAPGAAPGAEERLKEVAEASRAARAENVPDVAVLDPDAPPRPPSRPP